MGVRVPPGTFMDRTVLTRKKKYRERNRERLRLADAEWRKRNRILIRVRQKEMRITLKMEVLAQYGQACVFCGFSDYRALQIDHILDNGAQERKSLGGQNFSGHRFYYWLKKRNWPKGYQTLCANCNIIKHTEKMSRIGAVA